MKVGDYVSMNGAISNIFKNRLGEEIIEVRLSKDKYVCVTADMISLLKPAVRKETDKND